MFVGMRTKGVSIVTELSQCHHNQSRENTDADQEWFYTQ